MNLSARLKKLEEWVDKWCLHGCAFYLEGGGVFRTECDPLSYLLQYGTDTPRGRIVGLEIPEGENDPVTASIYDEIHSIINGKEQSNETDLYT